MASLLIVVLLLVLALGMLAAAIYEHVVATSLSLPIAPTLTAITIALPIIAAANAVYLNFSRRRQQHRLILHEHDPTTGALVPVGDQRARSPVWTWLTTTVMGIPLPSLPVLLQTLQGVMTVSAAALLIVNNMAGAGSSSPLLRCALESTWQRLYSAHDAAALRRIQDALNCCGFNSVVDRAWPFPHGSGGGSPSATCAESFGRSTACRVPWMQSTRRRAGVDLAVVVLVALFQAATLLGWEVPAFLSSQHHQVRRRPAFYRDDDETSSEADGHEQRQAPYSNGHENSGRNNNQSQSQSQNSNNGSQNVPRLEPSSLQNAWVNE